MTGCFGFGGITTPVDGSNPNTKRRMLVITDIRTNGIKTIIHEITLNPRSQRMLRRSVKRIIIVNLRMATLYNPLIVSTTTCVIEKTRYIKAGEHNLKLSMFKIG
jgi:hypothetical protein